MRALACSLPFLAAAALAACGGDDEAAQERAAGDRGDAPPIAVSPERPDEEDAIRITFPTPYAIGDITPGAVRWAEFLSARRQARGRDPVDPGPVGGGDNYHVIFSGPWGPECQDRREFALGHFAERGEDSLAVSIDRMLDEGGPAGEALWCPGRYSGYVEFRQLTVNRSKVPWERIGNFSFVIEPSRRG